MKKIKRYLINTSLGLALLCFTITKTSAQSGCTMCIPGNPSWCGHSDQPCSDMTPVDYPDATCKDDAIRYNPNKDYILVSKTGQAWIVANEIKQEIMSDALSSFYKKTIKKYSKEKKDKTTKEKMVKEFDAFRKSENKSVSTERLAKISEKLNLKVRKA